MATKNTQPTVIKIKAQLPHATCHQPLFLLSFAERLHSLDIFNYNFHYNCAQQYFFAATQPCKCTHIHNNTRSCAFHSRLSINNNESKTRRRKSIVNIYLSILLPSLLQSKLHVISYDSEQYSCNGTAAAAAAAPSFCQRGVTLLYCSARRLPHKAAGVLTATFDTRN